VAGAKVYPGVASLGKRPTVKAADAHPVLEVHVFDFSGDLYGQHVRVEFMHKLREEEKYPDLETLKAQIARDCDEARAILGARSSENAPETASANASANAPATAPAAKSASHP